MLNKLKDFCDTKVYMVILIDDTNQYLILTDVLMSIGLDRLSYEVYKDNTTAYVMELRMPYNRYLVMMKKIQNLGYNLRQKSEVGIVHRMIKN